MSTALRLVLACAGLSAWLALLLVGWSFGGWVHALLPVSIGLFPWRRPTPVSTDAGEAADGPRAADRLP